LTRRAGSKPLSAITIRSSFSSATRASGLLAVGIERVEHADPAPTGCPGSERAQKLQKPARSEPHHGHGIAVALSEEHGGRTRIWTADDVHLDHAELWKRVHQPERQAGPREVRFIGVDAISDRPQLGLGARPDRRPALDDHPPTRDPG
jgi:hypothetical protein